MDEVRYELDTGFREAPPGAEDDEMFPVNGVRSVVEPSGSSASMATRQLLELTSQELAWDKPLPSSTSSWSNTESSSCSMINGLSVRGPPLPLAISGRKIILKLVAK